MTLLAVPNFSEGRDADVIAAIVEALGPGVLDAHSDVHHNRTVVSLRADLDALLAGAAAAIAHIDLNTHDGVHPRVGALDVAPIVYTEEEDAGPAIALALVLADELAQLGLPVHLYGMLGRARAEVRRDPGTPDFGPHEPHPTAGRTLVTARPPLVAFNVEIDASLAKAKEIAAHVRGMPGVVALGVPLGGRVQVTTNLEGATTPGQLVAAVAERARVLGAELVGLAPEAAFEDFPDDVPMAAPRFIERVI